MHPRYKIGDYVTLTGIGTYEVVGIVKHGVSVCNCCYEGPYFLYKLGGYFWVAEDQLVRVVN